MNVKLLLGLLGDQWHSLVAQVAQAGDECVRPQSCHVRALLTPLQKLMRQGNVSKIVYLLREIQSLEAASCEFTGNQASAQFCQSAQDLVSVIAQTSTTCTLKPLINLIIKSVQPVTKAVDA